MGEANWSVGQIAWRSGGGTPVVCVPEPAGPFDVGDPTLSIDGSVLADHGSEFISYFTFPGMVITGYLDVRDLTLPAPLSSGPDRSFLGFGDLVMGPDGNYYAWLYDNFATTEPAICVFDPAGSTASILYAPGVSSNQISGMITWHPLDPGNFYALLIDNLHGTSAFFRVDGTTGARTDLITGFGDGSAYSAYQFQQYGTGIVFDNPGMDELILWDISTSSTTTLSTPGLQGYGTGRQQLLWVPASGAPADSALITVGGSVSIAPGGDPASMWSVGPTYDGGGWEGSFYKPSLWFAPGDRSTQYISNGYIAWSWDCGSLPTYPELGDDYTLLFLMHEIAEVAPTVEVPGFTVFASRGHGSSNLFMYYRREFSSSAPGTFAPDRQHASGSGTGLTLTGPNGAPGIVVRFTGFDPEPDTGYTAEAIHVVGTPTVIHSDGGSTIGPSISPVAIPSFQGANRVCIVGTSDAAGATGMNVRVLETSTPHPSTTTVTGGNDEPVSHGGSYLGSFSFVYEIPNPDVTDPAFSMDALGQSDYFIGYWYEIGFVGGGGGGGDGGGGGGGSGPYPEDYDDFPGVSFTELDGPYHTSTADEAIDAISVNDAGGDPSVQDSSGGYGGYTLTNSRFRSREGPRSDGDPISIDHCYIEVHAESLDHTDGVQAVGGSGTTITNTKILCGGGGATCMFFADGSTGAVVLDGDYFGKAPGYSQPGHLVRINSDGADTIAVSNCIFEQGVSDSGNVFDATIVTWTNNKWIDPDTGVLTDYPHP